jgi:hypothetical protein
MMPVMKYNIPTTLSLADRGTCLVQGSMLGRLANDYYFSVISTGIASCWCVTLSVLYFDWYSCWS